MSETIQAAYNSWSKQYDSNQNKTRDMEAIALREILSPLPFRSCLELGCGTGKNSVWLSSKAESLVSVDFSDEMLQLARSKVKSANCEFVQANLLDEWHFANEKSFDLLCFSLVLEHIQNLDELFRKAAMVLQTGGYLYLGELHPFKQYAGSKARYESEQGVEELLCFTHSITDFVLAGNAAGLKLVGLKEYFDEDNKELPRILTLLFQK